MDSILNTEWTTFNGRKVTLWDIDQQHLSNVYYFNTLIGQQSKNDDFIKILQKVLDEKFNGQLLPYRPHRNFYQEIKILEQMGYLNTNGEIHVNGVKIGEIVTTESIQL